MLDEEDNLVIDAAYEGAKAIPENDCFVWERGRPGSGGGGGHFRS